MENSELFRSFFLVVPWFLIFCAGELRVFEREFAMVERPRELTCTIEIVDNFRRKIGAHSFLRELLLQAQQAVVPWRQLDGCEPT